LCASSIDRLQTSSTVKVEVDFELRILPVVNPFRHELAQPAMIIAPIARALDLREQIPVTRLVIEREHKVQRAVRERLPHLSAARASFALNAGLRTTNSAASGEIDANISSSSLRCRFVIRKRDCSGESCARRDV